MKNFLGNLIKLILSILILLFGEEYFYKFMNFLGINLSKISSNIVSLIIYVVIAGCIFIVYKDELQSAFIKYKNKLGSNLLYTVISFLVLFIAIMISNYIAKYIAGLVSVGYKGLSFINIFNRTFSLDLIITIIKSIIIIPFVKVTIFVLGVNNLVNSKSGIFLSGLVYSLYVFYPFKASLLYMVVNAIVSFVLFSILAYIYKKNNNIAFSILTYILYVLFAGLLTVKFM